MRQNTETAGLLTEIICTHQKRLSELTQKSWSSEIRRHTCALEAFSREPRRFVRNKRERSSRFVSSQRNGVGVGLAFRKVCPVGLKESRANRSCKEKEKRRKSAQESRRGLRRQCDRRIPKKATPWRVPSIGPPSWRSASESILDEISLMCTDRL